MNFLLILVSVLSAVISIFFYTKYRGGKEKLAEEKRKCGSEKVTLNLKAEAEKRRAVEAIEKQFNKKYFLFTRDKENPTKIIEYLQIQLAQKETEINDFFEQNKRLTEEIKTEKTKNSNLAKRIEEVSLTSKNIRSGYNEISDKLTGELGKVTSIGQELEEYKNLAKDNKKELVKIHREKEIVTGEFTTLKKAHLEVLQDFEKTEEDLEKLAEDKEQMEQKILSENIQLQEDKRVVFQKLTELEKRIEKEVSIKLLDAVRKTSIANRYLSEMYRRGEMELQTYRDDARKVQILQDIENRIIDEKNAQVLTREGKLQLEMNTNVFELKKAWYTLQNQVDNFNLDQRDYEHNKRVEQERWEIKTELDKFNLERQSHALQVISDSLQDSQQKFELEKISEKIDIQRTRAELEQFSNNLSNEKQRQDIQKLLDNFDLEKQHQELKIYASKLDDEKQKNQLLYIADKLDLEKLKSELQHFANKLELKDERHQIEVIIDHFEIEKERTALEFAQEKFDLYIREETLSLQHRINALDNAEERHEMQMIMDNFNLETREKQMELDDVKRTIKHDINRHELQVSMDGFNLEMKEKTHGLKVLHDILHIKEQKFDITVEKEKAVLYNNHIEQVKKSMEQDFKNKSELLQIKIDRGELDARAKLQEIREKNSEVQNKLTDLFFSKKEVDLFTREKTQDLFSKEMKYKQETLYSLYDELEMGNGKYVDKAFSKMGFSVNSPYKAKFQNCQEEKKRLQQELRSRK